MVDTEKCFKVL